MASFGGGGDGGWGLSGGIGSGCGGSVASALGGGAGFGGGVSALGGVGRGGGARSPVWGAAWAAVGRRLHGGAQIRGRRGRGRGLRRGFRVLLAVGDLIEFAQRNGFNRNGFGVSANFGAEAKPSRSIASSAPCSAAEPAKFEYERRSSNAAPGYCLIGSVTRATFLNPAEVTAAMISATRP